MWFLIKPVFAALGAFVKSLPIGLIVALLVLVLALQALGLHPVNWMLANLWEPVVTALSNWVHSLVADTLPW